MNSFLTRVSVCSRSVCEESSSPSCCVQTRLSVLKRWSGAPASVWWGPSSQRGAPLKSGAAAGAQVASRPGPSELEPILGAEGRIKAGGAAERTEELLISGREAMFNIRGRRRRGDTREREEGVHNGAAQQGASYSLTHLFISVLIH